MFSGDYEPVIPEPNASPEEINSADSEAPELIPGELSGDVPPIPAARRRPANQSRRYDPPQVTGRLETCAAGASGRVRRKPTNPT